MKPSIVLIACFILGLSCKDKTQPIIVSHPEIQLTLPGFVEEDELAEDGIVEFANRYRNFYLVIVKDTVNKNLDSFIHFQTNRITKQLQSFKYDSLKLDSESTLYIQGKMKDEKELIHYHQKYVVRGNARYWLTVWVRGDERNRKYKDTVQGILNSFKSK